MIKERPQVITTQELTPDPQDQTWASATPEEQYQYWRMAVQMAGDYKQQSEVVNAENQLLREKISIAEEMLDMDLDDLIDSSTAAPSNSETPAFSPYDPKRFDTRLIKLKAQYQHAPDMLLEEIEQIARSAWISLDSNYRRDSERRERDTICQGIQQHPHLIPAEKDTLIGLVKESYDRYPSLDHTIEIQIGQFNQKHIGMSDGIVSEKIQSLKNMGCFDSFEPGEKVEVGDDTFTGPAKIKLSQEKLRNPLSIVKEKPQGGPRKKGCKVPVCPNPEEGDVNRFVTEYHEACDSVHISALPGTPSTANIKKAANAIKEGRVFWTGQLENFAENSKKQDAFDLTSTHIYVDEIRTYDTSLTYKQWCHMATNGDIENLHAMAEHIGLKREWFQNKDGHPHYDLTPSKRKQAIARGAVAVSSQELIQACHPRLASVMNGQKQDALSHDQADREHRGGYEHCATCGISIEEAEDFFIIDEQTGYCSEHKPQAQLQVGMRVQTPAGAATISTILTRCSVETDQQQEDGSRWKAFNISEVHPL